MENIPRTYDRWVLSCMPNAMKVFSKRITADLIKIPMLPVFSTIPDEVVSTFIYGDTEYGKTVYACHLLLKQSFIKYLSKNTDDYKATFVAVPDLFFNIRKGFDEVLSTNWIQDCKDVDFMILDDIGVKKPSEWEKEVLYLILNSRYEDMKITIITSNFSIDKLAELFGDDRITSRIQRMCEIVEKKDWRLK